VRASVSTLTATVLFLVVASTLLSAYLRLSYESTRAIMELSEGYARSYLANVWWDFKDGKLVLRSFSPTRVVAVFLAREGDVEVLSGEFVLDGEYYLYEHGEGKVIVVLEGGRYVVIDADSSPSSSSNEVLTESIKELQLSSRLLPLLAKYLDPQDYFSVVNNYTLENLAQFLLHPGYNPYVTWVSGLATYECYGNLIYVHLTWDSSYWYVTYRKCSQSGPIMDTLRAPRSSTQVPSREYLYHRECSTRSGVRYCFEVYVTIAGYCYGTCSSPQSSWWYFEVGMRVVYRFEPIEPGKYILVILNKTTFDTIVGKSAVTCYSYISWDGGCYRCSSNPWVGWCGVDTQQLVRNIGGPRPMFFWDIHYPQDLEYSIGDDGYELGSFYPRIVVMPSSWVSSDHYAYTAPQSAPVTLAFYVSGLYQADYLARTTTYHYGYYRVSFDLIFDEGGLGGDARSWDYRAVVFLMKS